MSLPSLSKNSGTFNPFKKDKPIYDNGKFVGIDTGTQSRLPTPSEKLIYSGGGSSKKPIATPTPTPVATAVKTGGTLLDSTQASREATARSLAEASRQKAFQNAVQQEALRRQRLNLPPSGNKTWEGKLLSPGDVGYVKPQKIVYLPEGSKLSGLDLNTTILYTDKFGRLTGDARIGNTSVGSGKLRELKGIQAGRIDSRYLQNIAQNIKIGELNRRQAVSNTREKKFEISLGETSSLTTAKGFNDYFKAIQDYNNEYGMSVKEEKPFYGIGTIASEKLGLQKIKDIAEERAKRLKSNIKKDEGKLKDWYNKDKILYQLNEIYAGIAGATTDIADFPASTGIFLYQAIKGTPGFLKDPITGLSNAQTSLKSSGEKFFYYAKDNPTRAFVRIGGNLVAIKYSPTLKDIKGTKAFNSVKDFIKSNVKIGDNVILGIEGGIKINFTIISKIPIKKVNNYINKLKSSFKNTQNIIKSNQYQKSLNNINKFSNELVNYLEKNRGITLSNQQKKLMINRLNNRYINKLFNILSNEAKLRGYIILNDGTLRKITFGYKLNKNIKMAMDELKKIYSPKLGARELEIQKQIKEAGSKAKKAKLYRKYFGKEKITKPLSFYQSNEWQEAINIIDNKIKSNRNIIEKNLGRRLTESEINEISNFREKLINNLDEARISKGIGINKPKISSRIKSYFNKLKREYSPKLGARELEIQKQIKEAGSKAKKAKHQKYIIEGDRFLTISKGDLIRDKQINKLNKLADEITKDFNSKNYGKNLASNSLKKKVYEQIIREIKKGKSLQSAIDYARNNLKKIRKFINNKERIIDYSKKNVKRIDNLNDKIEFKISNIEKENIPKKYKPSGSGSQQLLMKQKVKTKQKIEFEAQPSQIKSRFKSKQKSSMKQKVKTKQKIKMAGKALSASRILGMMSKPAIKSKSKFGIGSKSKIASASKFKSLSKSASKTASKSLTKSLIKSDIMSKMKTPTKNILQQRAIQKTKKIILPFTSNKSPQKQISQKKYGYVVYARPLKKFKSQRQPKLKKINLPPLNKNRAEDLRNYLTDTSLARTAEIRKIKQKPKEIKLNVPLGYASRTSNKFRDYRIVKGKKVTLPNSRVIEKAKYGLDTRQEVKRISLEKRIKQVIGKPVIRRSSISPYQRRILLNRLENARAVRMRNLRRK